MTRTAGLRPAFAHVAGWAEVINANGIKSGGLTCRSRSAEFGGNIQQDCFIP